MEIMLSGAMPLIKPKDMPSLDGVRVPQDLYVVLDDSYLLGGMRYPSFGVPWQQLYDKGFRGIVCLAGLGIPYNPRPLKVVFCEDLEDLCGGSYPRYPWDQEKLVRDAAAAALPWIRKGKGIIVHCAGGTGRTGTVLGCVIRELDYSADEAVNYLDEVNRARGRRWPESPWQEEMVRSYL